jgi:hypothetical protein
MVRGFLTRLRFFLSRQRAVDLDDELQFHLERSTQTNIAAGMSPEEARRQAGIAFGGVERTREQCYEQRPGRLLEAVLQDVRYALRWLGRNPIFTTAVITTLALGIGATTAVFRVVDSLLLRPLPYPNSERIVRIWNTFSPRGMNEIPLSEPEFLEYRQSQNFAHLAGFSLGTVTLTGTGDPLRLVASWGTYSASRLEPRLTDSRLATRVRSRETTRLRRAHSFGCHKYEIRSASRWTSSISDPRLCVDARRARKR